MCINELCLVKKVNNEDTVEIETPSGKMQTVRTFLMEERLKEGDRVIVQAGLVIDKVESEISNIE